MNTNRNCGVYALIHVETQNAYIGASTDLAKREYAHRNALKNKRHPIAKLRADFKASGNRVDAVDFMVLEYCTLAELAASETRWIDIMQPAYNSNRKSSIGAFLPKQRHAREPNIDDVITQLDVDFATGKGEWTAIFWDSSQRAATPSNGIRGTRFVTPWGTFGSEVDASDGCNNLMSAKVIHKMCRQSWRTINASTYARHRYLKTLSRDIIGSTWGEIGFGMAA